MVKCYWCLNLLWWMWHNEDVNRHSHLLLFICNGNNQNGYQHFVQFINTKNLIISSLSADIKCTYTVKVGFREKNLHTVVFHTLGVIKQQSGLEEPCSLYLTLQDSFYNFYNTNRCTQGSVMPEIFGVVVTFCI